jgi:succinate dehydrogenase / fumarate reductase cytochrome b subunit
MKHREFYLRRLHSFTGLLMGIFLFNHFLTNSFIFHGREAFNHKVHFIHSIPYLIGVEVAMVFLPFFFHMIYGFYILWTGRSNALDYGYGRNWMYMVQRVTAWILTPFIIYHVAEWRFYYTEFVMRHYDSEQVFILGSSFYDQLVVNFSQPWYWAVYLIGVLAAIVHFANGLCTFCMSWGITVGPKSQKKFIPVAILIALAYAALISLAFRGLWAQVAIEYGQPKGAALAMSASGLFF